MTSAEPDQPEPTPTPPKRDWIAIMVTALPGLAALIAVTFTYFSVKATENQLQIARQGQNTAQQGQITDRYNAAITNLGSRSIDVRLGGIYALQRLMQDPLPSSLSPGNYGSGLGSPAVPVWLIAPCSWYGLGGVAPGAPPLLAIDENSSAE